MQLTGIQKNINVKKSPGMFYPTSGNRSPMASFIADYVNNPTLVVGGVAPSTITRATIATVTDFEGVTREVLSGEMRFGGMRRVYNLVTAQTGLNGGAVPPSGWTRLAAGGTETSAPSTLLSGHSAITFSVSNNREMIGVTLTLIAGHRYVGSVYCEGKTGTLNESSLTVVAGTATLSGSPQVASSAFVSGRRIASAAFDCTGSGTVTFRLGTGVGALETGTGTITLSGPMLEDVTGQSNQNPSEYISFGVLAAPYNGAGVDGVQYFPWQNGNTVTSNIVTELQGKPINARWNKWAYTPGTPGSYFSTPDSVAASVTGNLDLRVFVAPTNWGAGLSQPLISKLRTAGQYSYDWTINALNVLRFRYSPDGNATIRIADSTVGVGSTAAGTGLWLRVTYNASSGAVLFYTSPDGITWTQLGAQVNLTAGNIFDGTDIVEIGFDGLSATGLNGRFYRAQIYNGINGTLAVDFNPNDYVSGGNFTSSTTGEVYTINGTATVFAGGSGTNFIFDSAGAAGLLQEASATDLLLARADARDMTTANWALGATLTRARTQIGADGQANFATLLTGGGVAATNRITMTFALAAASRTYSVLLKRGVGTGAVLITGDGFGTTTDVSSLLNTSTFTKVSINANVLNPVIGIQVSTNADTVIADWNQYVAGDTTGLVDSRIPTSITTRNTDFVRYATTGWFNAAAGTLYGEWLNPNQSMTGVVWSISDATTNNLIDLEFTTITSARASVNNGGVSQSSLSAVSITGGAVAKSIMTYQANNFTGYANNTSLGTDVAGTIPTVTTVEMGSVATALQMGSYLRKAIYYPLVLPTAVQQALTN